MVKVVIVDDDYDLLELVCLMLETHETSPVCLQDCKQTLSTLNDYTPHVLVMDIFLGDCDGRKLCKQVKSSERFANLPVILYSAGVIDPATIEECGADHFFKKPFEMDALLQRVHNLANRSN